jgi:hypothetical protein
VRFTVHAEESAINELAEIWMNAIDRKGLETASNSIDHMLRTDPLSHGIESGLDRIVFVPPLGVVYKVKPEDGAVVIKKYYDLA